LACPAAISTKGQKWITRPTNRRNTLHNHTKFQ
jgi:hypothetical protein